MRGETDRRVRRTRELLHRALVSLILERGYTDVTVQDILDRAEVGRSTFYAHFRNKEDLLLLNGLEHLRGMFVQEFDVRGKPEALLRPARSLFRMAGDNRRLYRCLMGTRGSDQILRTVRRQWAQLMTEHVRASLHLADERQLEVTVEFVVSGLMGLLTWWLDSDAAASADEMYARFEQLALCGLQSLLGSGGLDHEPADWTSGNHCRLAAERDT